ncbi:uncharacterized protein LOC142759747 [Rhinoderma darwinii]|uniref:uncharacterized protein LOC142652807 n=1 Tax=Rhinoderma darwinii TaxID=43563 RepID=UPI003F680ECA
MEQVNIPAGNVSSNTAAVFTEEDIERILSGAEGDVSFLSVPSITDIKRNLEFESRRLINVELHLLTLGQYYRNNMIPRGMRILLKPTMHMQHEEFRNKNEQLASKYALETILLNMDFLQRDLRSLRVKVQDLENTLKTLVQTDDFNVHMEKLRMTLNKVRMDIEETKKKKWFRDQTDYSMGRVYTWDNSLNYADGAFRRDNKRSNEPAFNKSDSRNQFHTKKYPPSNNEDFLDSSPLDKSKRRKPDEQVVGEAEEGRTRFQKSTHQKGQKPVQDSTKRTLPKPQ